MYAWNVCLGRKLAALQHEETSSARAMFVRLSTPWIATGPLAFELRQRGTQAPEGKVDDPSHKKQSQDVTVGMRSTHPEFESCQCPLAFPNYCFLAATCMVISTESFVAKSSASFAMNDVIALLAQTSAVTTILPQDINSRHARKRRAYCTVVYSGGGSGGGGGGLVLP